MTPPQASGVTQSDLRDNFISGASTAVADQLAASKPSRMFRNLLFSVLKKLRHGSLELHEAGEVFHFGESTSQGVKAKIAVHDAGFYGAVITGGTIGAGESYMRGEWSSNNLVDVVRLMSTNIALTNDMDSSWSAIKGWALKLYHSLRSNTKIGSKKNIAAHYDLGNDFFSLFLDKSMMYSAAVYESPSASLEQAAEAKLDRICKRLNLQPTDHLLEIGTGWGGMAIHAAKHYGCRVTTTTISQQQYDYACAWVEREGLQDKITLLLEDYRDLTGCYDKLVSVEMIEAVGHKFYAQYFATCSKLLKDDGLMLIQAITIADQRFNFAKNNVDFIQRYIFPGGALPSVSVIGDCLRDYTDMQLVGLEEIGIHYARTLADWRTRFWAAIDKVRGCGFDETFIRMWDFYLCYCEGGFRERAIGTSQLLMAKPRAQQLPAPVALG
ncbi:cyclopropane-fatty-acyl-phospholipid synthase family protein [Simiduia curdlanivorans]|uniref:Class I SAM-dependent methyltransferase n=1 Tax=Simiduia curdlanivorans TaxID=1492769 RepID=A0ABV8V4T7_9GAMM|nr:cyclopropane-fatty-acyl-phospholipid synthase family protein [Simiduia curdlanivorans]MDN3640971.1 cyclopropane-fatty-acyl-phospholipid synthase family protein [Simiduia curdlanivorans]